MKIRHRKSLVPPDESGSMSGRDRVSADMTALRVAIRQLATRKLRLHRQAADRLAVERAEDEGMTIHAG